MTRVASGHVKDRPFARTIYALVARRFSGEVVLEDAGRTYRVAWADGVVVAAVSAAPADSLSRVAVAAGVLTTAQLSEVLAVTSQGKSEAAALLELGHLQPSQLASLQRRALAHRAMRIFQFPNASFAIEDTVTIEVDADVPPLDGRWVIYHGLRTHYDEKRLRSELQFLAGKLVQLRPEALAVLGAFGFTSADKPLLATLRDGPLTVDQVAASENADERVAALAVLYALAASSCLAGSDAPAAAPTPPAPPVAPRAAAPAAPTPTRRGRSTAPPPPGRPLRPVEPRPEPPARTPAVASDGELAALVAEKLALIDARGDHFSLLGVGKDTPMGDIQRAYFDLARKLHPDRLRAANVIDERADTIFAVVNQAFGVLGNATKRAEYIEQLASGGNSAERHQAEREAEELALKLINAEVAYQRGELALKAGNIPEALAAFTEAVELNPDEGEHHALLGWATWCSAADKDAVAKSVRASFRKAISLSPKSVPAYFYRGQVAKQSGQLETAVDCFVKVLELEPGHRGADTELRLLDKRTEKGKKSLFDRLKR